jgi:flagellar hook assembly protein FlgD
VKSFIAGLCFLSAGALGAAPLGLAVEMPYSQFRLGEGAAIFVVHGPPQGRLRAAILDEKDREVAVPKFVNEETLQWDGRDREGRWVRPGTYYVEIVEEPYLWDGAIVVNP